MAEEGGRVPMSAALQTTLLRARDYAASQSHPQVLLEHLLLALTEDADATLVLEASRVDLVRLRNDVASYIGNLPERQPAGVPPSPAISPGLTQVLKYATLAAQQGRRQSIDGAIVLAALVGDGRSMAASFLKAQGLTFEAAIRVLREASTRPAPAPAPAMRAPTTPHAALPQNLPAGEPAPKRPISPTEDILAAARERVVSRTGGQGAQASPAGPPPQEHVSAGEMAAAPPARWDAHEATPSAPAATPLDASAAARRTALEAELPNDETPMASPTAAELSADAGAMHPAVAPELLAPQVPPFEPAGALPAHTDEQRAGAAFSGGAAPPAPAPPHHATAATQQAADYAVQPGIEPRAATVVPDAPPPSDPHRPSVQRPSGSGQARPAAITTRAGGRGPSSTGAEAPTGSWPPPPRAEHTHQPVPMRPPAPSPAAFQPTAPAAPLPAELGAAEMGPAPSGWAPPASMPAPPMAPPARRLSTPPAAPWPGRGMPTPVPQPGPGPGPRRDGEAAPQPAPPWSDDGAPHADRRPSPPYPAPVVSPGPMAAPPSRQPSIEAAHISPRIPRRLRQGHATFVEISIDRPPLAGMRPGPMPDAFRNEAVVARAISVRLRPIAGRFAIDAASPETVWDQGAGPAAGRLAGEAAVWRFAVVPLSAGKGTLQLSVVARTIGADGVLVETPLPEQSFEVRSAPDLSRRLLRISALVLAAAAGVIVIKGLEVVLGVDAAGFLKQLPRR